MCTTLIQSYDDDDDDDDGDIVFLLPGAYNSIRESYERSTAAQRRVDSTTDIVRQSQQVRRAVDDLLQRRQDEFDNGYSFNNVSLTNISIRIDRFRTRIRDLNDLVSAQNFTSPINDSTIKEHSTTNNLTNKPVGD